MPTSANAGLLQVPLSQALRELSENNVQVLGGGTDFYPALGDKAPPESVLDLTRISGLNSIARTSEGWSIGATATWSDIINASLPPLFDGLKAAAREVGSIQIQNSATVGGNLCNASPAADGVPPLLCLDAQVKLSSASGDRLLPLRDFITGPRATLLQSNEILSAIHIPAIDNTACGVFQKLGARRYLVISIAMVSVVLAQDEHGRLSDARIAVGSCAAVAQRLTELERILTGQSARSDLASFVTPAMFERLDPIDDVRSTVDYRMHAAQQLVGRLLVECARKLPECEGRHGAQG